MTPVDKDTRLLIAEVSKEIVAEIAPEELELFDELISGYFDDPTPPAKGARKGDKALAFGLENMVIAATPAVAAATSGVLGYLWNQAPTGAKQENPTAIKEKMQAIFHSGKTAKDAPQPLSEEQLRMVRQIAQKEAETMGLQPELAEQLANALVERLTQ